MLKKGGNMRGAHADCAAEYGSAAGKHARTPICAIIRHVLRHIRPSVFWLMRCRVVSAARYAAPR
jgi:hypothetical protein